MDLPEYLRFLAMPGVAPRSAPMIVVDDFVGPCPPSYSTHGDMVDAYASLTLQGSLEHMQSVAPLSDVIQEIASNYSEGTVVTISDNSIQQSGLPEAVQQAYDAEVLLVGAPWVFSGLPEALGDKVLQCWPMNSTGAWPGIDLFTGTIPNLAGVGAATYWFDGATHLISLPGHGGGCGPALLELGSFSTPLFAGSVQRVADVVKVRGDYEVAKVIDYVISGCDREVDPGTYTHRLNEQLPSFGPWSPTWGYGAYSAWKALIYAYGFGVLEARDIALDPGALNPPTVFSDHFELRGDLFVPANQTFRVSPLASVRVVTTIPEGPNLAGLDESKQEILVAGSMEVETGIGPVGEPQNGVNSSLVVDAGGGCTIKSGGLVTISAGQVLDIRQGGILTVAAGGRLVVEGEAVISGVLTVQSGGEVSFAGTAIVQLNTDLTVSAGGRLTANEGARVTAATSDLGGSGNDPARVEIICAGAIECLGVSGQTVEFKGATEGAGAWAGIRFTSTSGAASTLSHVTIKDAVTGLAIGGSAGITSTQLKASACGTGVEVTNRSDVTVSGGTVSGCTTGIKLTGSNASITGVTLNANQDGIRCEGSNPTVANCVIYGNQVGVRTVDSGSIPDLAGSNSFKKPWNAAHIMAYDPTENIIAVSNWWGTTVESQIGSRILVIDAPPTGSGSVVYHPFLTSPPPSALGEAVVDEPSDADAPEGIELRAVGVPVGSGASVGLMFQLPTSVHAEVDVFDVRGRRVRSLLDGELSAGRHEVVWDGNDEQGRRVPAGVYFVTLNSPAGRSSTRVVTLR